ncbi:MAG: sugar phosphate isomerase/epimerase family protein [Limnochordia bacterium]|jgi:sugar phosphate isomerase/epimerase
MIQPWNGYMKVGIIQFMLYPAVMKGEGPILETLERIVTDDFFSAVEVTTMKDDAVREKARQMLEATKMDVYFGAQPILLSTKLNVNDLDETGRRNAVNRLKEAVDEAYELGAKGFAFLAGPDPGDAQREKGLELLADSIREICEHAAKKGDMKVALEVFDRDIEKNSIIGPSKLAGEFAAKLQPECPNFGLMHDLSHVPLLRESSMESLSAVKDQLIHIHIGNALMNDPKDPAYGDAHPRFGYPGSENDVPELVEFLKALFAIGYLKEDGSERPVVSFEVKPVGDESSEIVLANAKRTLLEAWAQL